MQQMKEKAKSFKTDGSSVVKVTFKRLPYILLLICSLLMIGLTELIKPDFKWETFLSSQYWFNVIFTNLSYFLATISATLYQSDKIVRRDEDGEIKTATKTLVEVAPELHDNSVDVFLYETNRNFKKEKYAEKIRHKLFKLDQRMTRKQLRIYNEYLSCPDSEEKDTIYDNYKFIRKKVTYEEMVTEKWLEEHIDFVKMNCKQLKRRLLTVGSSSQMQEDIPTADAKILIGGILPKSLLSISCVTLFLTFGIKPQDELTWVIVIPIVFKFIMLVVNYIYGIRFAEEYVKITVVDKLYLRIRWLKRFIEWKKHRTLQEQQINQNIPKTAHSQDIQEEVQQEVTDTDNTITAVEEEETK